MSPMSTARSYSQAGLAKYPDGSLKVVVAGGYNTSTSDMKMTEVYDVATNSWVTSTPIRTPSLSLSRASALTLSSSK